MSNRCSQRKKTGPCVSLEIFHNISALFKVLAHPARVRILTLLTRKEYDVGDLQLSLGLSQSNVSQHLHALRTHGIVSDRRSGKHVYYRLKNPQALPVLLGAFQFVALQMASDPELIGAYEELFSMLPL